MPRTHPPYAPEFRRRIVEMARARRPIAQLGRDSASCAAQRGAPADPKTLSFSAPPSSTRVEAGMPAPLLELSDGSIVI